MLSRKKVNNASCVHYTNNIWLLIKIFVVLYFLKTLWRDKMYLLYEFYYWRAFLIDCMFFQMWSERWLILSLQLLLLLLAVGLPARISAQDSASCTFNSMCFCKAVQETFDKGVNYPSPNSQEHLRDVSCFQVPFSKFPGK